MKKISLTIQITWAERLAMLLGSGIALSDALGLMQESARDERARSMNEKLLAGVTRGSALSSELQKIPGTHLLLVRAVQIGELAGSLADMLRHVAASFRARERMRDKFIGAGMYPACIGCATLGIAGFLVLYIFPKVMPLFLGMHITLPLPTRMLLWLSHMVSGYWWLILGILVLLAFGAWYVRRYASVISFVEKIIFATPYVGGLFKEYITAQIFRVIALLLEHGATLPHALAESHQSITSPAYRRALLTSAEIVTDGGSFAQTLSAPQYRKLFSSEVTGLLNIAERSGESAATCGHIARIADERLEQSLLLVSRLIEPVLMLGMGLVVGSIALSIIMPIYEITNQLAR